MSIRDKAKEAQDLPMERIEVPEWGTTLWVRTVGASERDAFEADSMVKRGRSREVNLRHLRARMAVLCCCEEDGRPAFTPEDVAWLGTKSAKVLARIHNAAVRLNGWSDEDVEEMAKN